MSSNGHDFQPQPQNRGRETPDGLLSGFTPQAALEPLAVARPTLAVHPVLHPPIPPTFAKTAGAIG
jgi:hypothetical protein